jgi:hypothetical protein
LPAADWTIPVAGNAYRTAPQRAGGAIRRDGTLDWRDPGDVFSIFFHIDRPAELELALDARGPRGPWPLVVRVGEEVFHLSIAGDEFARCPVGRIQISQPGYVRVDLSSSSGSGNESGEIRDLLVSSRTEGLMLDCVRTNEGNMYYWGRRGPSVHLRFEVPGERPLQYAYCEITVPEGQDPIGSYYMANGFAEGYFGIQVNGPAERRVLFSVWSPFQTDDPRQIPEDQRIVAVAKGPDVRIGEFGNEGSGGQSYLVYPWRAGNTYSFLTEVEPDGKGNTVYTSWLADKSDGRWRLIASFRRPMTDTHLRGFHSFLESFAPEYGFIGRRARYGNVWVGDVDGKWHPCTQARFSVDATGDGRHRLDFSGGVEGDDFFLRNCGFFPAAVRPGETFTRQSPDAQSPGVNVERLPRG